MGGGGHSVVIYGYKKTADDTIEFYCYDVNHPTLKRTIYCSKSLGLWQFLYPEKPNYIFFFPGDVVTGNWSAHPWFEYIRSIHLPHDNWCSQLPNPTIVGSVDTPYYAGGVYVSGSYAYVADMASGLQVIDISSPQNPTIVGSVDTPDMLLALYVSGSYAYMANGYSGLQVIRIFD